MEQQGFLNLKDMFDGGGAGAYGDRFEGGGLLSDVANALFQPLGYRERMRGMQETRPMARPMSITQPAPMAPPAPASVGSGMTPANNYVGPPAPAPMGSGMTPANAYVPTPTQPQYSGRGVVGMPYPPFAQTPEQRATIDYLRSIGVIDY